MMAEGRLLTRQEHTQSQKQKAVYGPADPKRVAPSPEGARRLRGARNTMLAVNARACSQQKKTIQARAGDTASGRSERSRGTERAKERRAQRTRERTRATRATKRRRRRAARTRTNRKRANPARRETRS